jgi:T5SS/PEP-CTERM-associated repeat protein
MRSGKAFSCTIIVSLSLVLTLVWSCPAAASITAIGDIEPAYEGSDPWFLPTNVQVGVTADANLAVSGGSQIRSYNYTYPLAIALAWDPGVTASLTVTGPGSLVNASTTTGVSGDASLLVADGATLSGYDAVLAENAGSTGLATITGTGSRWENGRNLEVGRGGDATLTVADGGTLTSAFGYLGVDAGSVGRVTVTGPNSLWDNHIRVSIGELGDGTLSITDGGRVLSDDVSAGINEGGTATINVSGPGSLLEARDYLSVGFEGHADMVISSGARVHSGSSQVAWGEQSIGTVTVTGPNSVWEAGDSLTLGVHGDASMTVAAGGRVVDQTAHIAAEAESVSSALVTGSGSRWENSSTLFLGEFGNGTLTVADGATLMTTGVIAGREAGSSGTLLVTGAGTILQGAPVYPITIPENPPDANTPTHLSLEAIIGDHGTGTVTIADGARVTTEEGIVYLGYWPDGVGSLTVTGPNSVWDDTGMIQVGHFGAGTLLISNGGAVIGTKNAYIGGSYWPLLANPTSSQGSVMVADPGSLWRVGGTLMVGDIGQGELLVSAGGRVESRWGYVNDLATVTGAGSLWQNERSLTVDGWLKVEAGGQVTDANAYVGYSEDGNALVHVTGAGSRWDTTAELQVGRAGLGTLSIEQGGRVVNATGIVGAEETGAGVVTVTGPNSVWENLFVWDNPVLLEGHGGDLYVGRSGQGMVGVGSGGHVISQSAALGQNATGEGEVVVDGADSLWENNLMMEVGRAGTGRLWITNGGRVTTQEATVAVEPGSTGEIIVEGPGSELEVEWGMVLGARGDAAMSVTGGGHVWTNGLTMGAQTGSTATATVRGVGTWCSSWGSIYVGKEGSAELAVSDGAIVWANSIMGIGGAAGGVGTVSVAGAGSYAGGDALEVGIDGGRGRMTILDGAGGGGSEAWVGSGLGGLGEVVVSGPGSAWGTTYNLHIGDFYGEGRLTVADGAQVETLHGYIGVGPGSLGSVLVTDPNSLLRTSHTLYIGGDEEGPQGTGYLGIYDGGLVDGNSVVIWPTGFVMGDGTLSGNDISVFGTIEPGASIGTLTIEGNLSLETGGVLEVEIDNSGQSDLLDVTGAFTLAGGTVRPVPVETIVGSHQYTIVEANSVAYIVVAGSSDVWSTALLDSDIVVGPESDPNTVLLDVAAVPFNDPNITRTANQRSLGAALEQIGVQDPNNEVTMALQQLPTADEVRQAYDQLNGQTIPALAPVSVVDTTKYMSMISHRLRYSAGGFAAGAGLPSSPAGTGPAGMSGGDRLGVNAGGYDFAVGNGTPYLSDAAWALWGSGYGLFGDRDSEGGVPGYDYHIYGGAFGLDYQYAERLLLGVTLGYSEGSIDYASSPDEADIAGTHVGLYGRYATPRWYLDAIGTYTGLSYETHRFVDLLGEKLEGEPSGYVASGYIEAGLYRWWSPRCLIQPLAAFQFAQVSIDSFTESGGAAALHFASERFDSYQGSLGVKVTQELCRHDDGCRASVELRGRWVHEFGDTRASLDADFASDPGVVFQVSDAALSRDSAVLGAGLDTWFGRSFRAFADYTAALNSDGTLQAVSAGLEYRW